MIHSSLVRIDCLSTGSSNASAQRHVWTAFIPTFSRSSCHSKTTFVVEEHLQRRDDDTYADVLACVTRHTDRTSLGQRGLNERHGLRKHGAQQLSLPFLAR